MHSLFSLTRIRAKARQTLQETAGIFFLPLLAVFLGLTIQFISSRSQDPVTIVAVANQDGATWQYLSASIGFPIFSGILLSFLYLSISYTLFQILYKGKTQTGFKDGLAIFQHPEFGKIVTTYFTKTFFLFLWGLPLLIGSFLLIGASVFVVFYMVSNNISQPELIPEAVLATFGLGFFGGLFLSLIGFALYLPQYYAYSLVDILLFQALDQGHFTGARKLLKQSRLFMRGYKVKRFLLDLSFVGWFILISLTFGMVGVYVLPYYYASQWHFYQTILETNSILSQIIEKNTLT